MTFGPCSLSSGWLNLLPGHIIIIFSLGVGVQAIQICEFVYVNGCWRLKSKPNNINFQRIVANRHLYLPNCYHLTRGMKCAVWSGANAMCWHTMKDAMDCNPKIRPAGHMVIFVNIFPARDMLNEVSFPFKQCYYWHVPYIPALRRKTMPTIKQVFYANVQCFSKWPSACLSPLRDVCSLNVLSTIDECMIQR